MRNYGIDLYRIVLTFMICVLHTLKQGGLLYSCDRGTPYYALFWLLEIICYCAVDGYALISGYNARKKELNYSKLIQMWFQVVFYSFVLTLIFKIIKIDTGISLNTLIFSLIPVTKKEFWYFTAYVPLAILSPFIVKGLEIIEDDDLKKIFILIILTFTFSGLLFDCYCTDKGYSFVWLTLLYILGYIIKRLDMFNKWSSKILLLCSMLMVLITWSALMILGNVRLISYISPTILFNAIFLLIIFSRLKPTKISSLIKYVVPATLGIYLFQNNRVVWSKMKDAFLFVNNMNILKAVPCVLCIALAIFLLGLIVERVRIRIFKILRIEKLSSYLNEKILKIINILGSLLFD